MDLRARGASLCQAALQNIIIPAVNQESDLLTDLLSTNLSLILLNSHCHLLLCHVMHNVHVVQESSKTGLI